MKKITLLLLPLLFLSGCATYKFHHGKEPYSKGYVVSRDDYTILEYTLSKDNTVPKLPLAKVRFKRRRNIVEDYYKRMGYIENRFKMAFMDPAVYFLKLVGGVFRLPFIAVSDYRQAHNPAYKERLRRIEDEKDAREEARINKIKEKLNTYIQKDLSNEPPQLETAALPKGKPAPQAVTPAPVPKEEPAKVELPKEEPGALPKEEAAATQPPKEEPVKIEVSREEAVMPVAQPVKEGLLKRMFNKLKFKRSAAAVKPKPVKEKVAKPKAKKEIMVRPKSAAGQPVAVIIAKPSKGFSPLKVHFYGGKSYVPKGRIIAHTWDFGDQDTSTKPNPVNTYYSATSEPQYFTVRLTAQDDLGNTAETTTTIEVLNK